MYLCTCPSSSACTLRQAIVSTFAGDVIECAPSITTVTITADATLSLNNSITIDGANRVTITGNGNTSVFVVEPGASVQLIGTDDTRRRRDARRRHLREAEGGTLALNDSTRDEQHGIVRWRRHFQRRHGDAGGPTAPSRPTPAPDHGGGIFSGER